MADPIVLPKGAFAAIKSGQPVPAAPAPAAAAPKADTKPAPKVEAKAEVKPAQAEPPKDATAAERKIWKLKSNGKEVDFDATDESAIKAQLEKALGADDTFRTAAQIRRQAEDFLAMLRTPDGAKKVLQDPRLGLDFKKLAEEVVWEHIQQQQREEEWKKDPSKKKAWDDEQELKSHRDREARGKEEAATKQQQADQARWVADYDQKITKALEIGGIPKTEASVARMAEQLTVAVQQGLDLSPEELVQTVRQDYISDVASLLGAASGEQLLELLGEAGAKKLREADLKRLRSPETASFPKRSNAKRTAETKGEPAQKRLAGSDWRAQLAKDFLSRPK